MFKKIIAASAIFAFFACSGEDNYEGDLSSSSLGNNLSSSSENPSSSSGDPDNSSSSENPSSSSEDPGDSSSSENPSSSAGDPSSSSGSETHTILIASLNNTSSEILGTSPYGYTMKAGQPEDLTQFWSSECPTTTQPSNPPSSCRLGQTNAILQNPLTNQYSDLHYNVRARPPDVSSRYSIKLDQYNLTQAGDQAALGLNARDDGTTTIGHLQLSQLDGTISFIYRGSGGVHVFRAVSSGDNDFWEYRIPATGTNEVLEIEIPVSEFTGMGSYAANGGVPFDISQVAKFLWVVEYDAAVPENNQGSLWVYDFRARVANE